MPYRPKNAPNTQRIIKKFPKKTFLVWVKNQASVSKVKNAAGNGKEDIEVTNPHGKSSLLSKIIVKAV
jgi:hypothetical protein